MVKELDEELRELARQGARPEWNETDVREEVIAPLLRLLGYKKDTDYDISREQPLLVHPFLMVGSQKVRLDYAFLARRKRMWVLEAKRPSVAVVGEAIHQAYHYAIHPEVQARFFAVCNGIELAVYDVHEVDERYAPVLRFELKDLVTRFPELRNILGHDRVRDEVVRRAILDLEKVLPTELRAERINAVDQRIRAVIANARTAAEENARALRVRRAEQDDEEMRLMHARTSPVQMARVVFEFLDTAHRFEVIFEVWRGKLMSLPAAELGRTVLEVLAVLDLDLMSSHRTTLMQALLRLLPDLDPELGAAVRRRLGAESAAILAGFPENERARLLWQLEGLVKRVPYKVSMARGEFTEQLKTIVARKRTTLPEEDLVANPPSVWNERFARSYRKASELFHQLKLGDTRTLSSTIAELVELERAVSGPYRQATERMFDGEPEPPYFVYFDEPIDGYRSGLCNVLFKEFGEASRVVDEAVLAGIEDALRRAKENVYSVNSAGALWVRLIHLRGGMVPPVDPETGLALPAEAVQHLMNRPDIHRAGWSALESGVLIRGQIAPGRWAQIQARLDLTNRRVLCETMKHT